MIRQQLDSLPEFVMRTGVLAPFGPTHVRQDVRPAHIRKVTSLPTGAPTAPNRPTTTAAPLPTIVAPPQAPGQMNGYLAGADAAGRPVREFPQEGAPTTLEAKTAAAAIKKAASLVRARIPAGAIPALVGGPISSLVRGEAVVLRWPNGVAIQAAL